MSCRISPKFKFKYKINRLGSHFLSLSSNIGFIYSYNILFQSPIQRAISIVGDRKQDSVEVHYWTNVSPKATLMSFSLFLKLKYSISSPYQTKKVIINLTPPILKYGLND